MEVKHRQQHCMYVMLGVKLWDEIGCKENTHKKLGGLWLLPQSRRFPHLVFFSTSFLIILQNVISNVVLRVNEKLLCVALLFSTLHPDNEEQYHCCKENRERDMSEREWSTVSHGLASAAKRTALKARLAFSLEMMHCNWECSVG